jgi:hypothetical protein
MPSEREGSLVSSRAFRTLAGSLACARDDSKWTKRSANCIPSLIVVCSQSITRCAFPNRRQNSIVARVPPLGSPLQMIRVPSESRTFASVRAAYCCVGISCNRYPSGILPSSASRPAGHQPPESAPNSSAASNAPRSTPVCPPEMIFSNYSSTARRSRVSRLIISGRIASHRPSSKKTRFSAGGTCTRSSVGTRVAPPSTVWIVKGTNGRIAMSLRRSSITNQFYNSTRSAARFTRSPGLSRTPCKRRRHRRESLFRCRNGSRRCP